jgi:uncharacterized protein
MTAPQEERIMATRTGLILAAAVWALCAAAPAGAPQRVARHCALRFDSGRRITADVVDTPAGREKGLMFRRSLPKDYGMLFVFPFEMGMNFWMKNTWVSLDIVFIGKDKKITRVHERVRPSTEETTDAEVARVGGPAQYVLELPAGAARRYKLKAGQALAFDAAIPER